MRTPPSSVSATIRSFSRVDQRRRRSLTVMISIAPPDINLILDLKHRSKVITKATSARRGWPDAYDTERQSQRAHRLHPEAIERFGSCLSCPTPSATTETGPPAE